MSASWTTLVIGASPHPHRYSYLAVQQLQKHGYPVIALGIHEGMIDQVPIVTSWPSTPVHTVSLYLHPRHQHQYENKLIAMHPVRVIFNPGTENAPLEQHLREAGIAVIEACTLVLLSTHQFETAGLNQEFN